MTANELQIGDWVYYEGEPIMVYEIDEYYKRINTEPDGYNAITCVEISDIKPIPLTEEILEKNGFVKDETQYGEDFYEFWSEDLEYCMYLYLYDVCFFLFDNINMQIKYVHELQHAMRLCNIEKKIEL